MSQLGAGWQNIVGHEWAVQMLNSAIVHNRVGHAYLLTGPGQIGKMTLARTFAQALNCTADPEKRPCGECRACRLVVTDRHPDVRVIRPEVSDRGLAAIKIEQIRQLQQDLSLSTYEARYKIALLKRIDTANLNAANAFLKTLEEPPGHVILLLTANDPDRVLPTIVSRCRVLGLRALPVGLIEESLMTRWKARPDNAHLLAHLSAGRLGWAVRAHEDAALLQTRETQLATLQQALSASLVARFAMAETLSKRAETLPQMLETWVGWWRDLSLLAYGRRSPDTISNIDETERLYALASQWSRDRIRASLQQTAIALRQIAQNANTRLVLENVFLTYPQAVGN